LLPSFLGDRWKFEFVSVASHAEQFANIAQWVEECKCKIVIEEDFELKDVRKAFGRLTWHTRVKLVIKVPGG